MNLWVIHQTAAGTKKWKLVPRKNPWVLGTSREANLRINSIALTPILFGAFEFDGKQWGYTRLTAPDPNTNIQRSIAISETTEIVINDQICVRVVPMNDRAEILGTKENGERPDKSQLGKIIQELTRFNLRHFFDKETSPFFGTAFIACLLLLVFVELVPKSLPNENTKGNTNLNTVEVRTDFMVKSKAISQAMKNSVAPKQLKTAAASGTIKNSKKLIGAIFSKIQGRSLEKVLKNVNLTASSKNVVSGVLAKSLSQFSKNIPDGKQLAAMGTGQAGGLGEVGVNTVGTGSRDIANIGKMDHGSVGKAKIGLLSEESEVKGGLDREVISSYIQTKLGPILYCYERQLSANPSLFGKVAVKFSIKADGFVDHSEISETTLLSGSVEACLLSQVNQWKFPKPAGGLKVVVTYPFMFKSVN